MFEAPISCMTIYAICIQHSGLLIVEAYGSYTSPGKEEIHFQRCEPSAASQGYEYLTWRVTSLGALSAGQ